MNFPVRRLSLLPSQAATFMTDFPQSQPAPVWPVSTGGGTARNRVSDSEQRRERNCVPHSSCMKRVSTTETRGKQEE